MNLILHSCCAPCVLTVISQLPGDCSITAHFFNPNIHPYKEFEKRLLSVRKLVEEDGIPARLEAEYLPEKFFEKINGKETNRCEACYFLRLSRSAEFAKQAGADAFTTTLLCSPYQDLDLIRQIGDAAGQRYGVPFYFRDFRPGFRKGHDEARERQLYLQPYCGCVFSEKERYYKPGK
ncbi:MAG: epoxyqueuosine reductase QueH [Chloroflexi bacterium]|nr:epoxyqueuosine reductase QueH [Chloroflexota bacterium]